MMTKYAHPRFVKILTVYNASEILNFKSVLISLNIVVNVLLSFGFLVMHIKDNNKL